MGNSAEMFLQWDRPSTEVIDLLGNTATPGLTDSHLHLSMVAEQTRFGLNRCQVQTGVA